MKSTRECVVSECDQNLSYNNKSGFCLSHRPWKYCLLDGCGKRLRPDNKSGFCSDHFHLSPQKIEKQNLSQTDDAANRKWYRLKSQYNLSEDDYDNLVLTQFGLCPLCCTGLSEYGTVNGPHIDHDHECCPGRKSCGKCIRGVLHAPCNRLLERIESVRKMDTTFVDMYLKENSR